MDSATCPKCGHVGCVRDFTAVHTERTTYPYKMVLMRDYDSGDSWKGKNCSYTEETYSACVRTIGELLPALQTLLAEHQVQMKVDYWKSGWQHTHFWRCDLLHSDGGEYKSIWRNRQYEHVYEPLRKFFDEQVSRIYQEKLDARNRQEAEMKAEKRRRQQQEDEAKRRQADFFSPSVCDGK